LKEQENGAIFLVCERDFLDVFGLGSLRSVRHLKLNFLTLDQGLVAIAGYRAVMNKDILLAGLLDKSITFRVIEPLDHTNSLRHFLFPPTTTENSDHQSQIRLLPEPDTGTHNRCADPVTPGKDKQKILECKINGV
jgi:hypothetical protein